MQPSQRALDQPAGQPACFGPGDVAIFKPATTCFRWCGELRQRAAAYLRRERRDLHLNRRRSSTRCTCDSSGGACRGRIARTSLGSAAQMMRRILVDHARAHQAIRRPGAD